MAVPAFELALKDDSPEEYLASDHALRSFTLNAGLDPKDPGHRQQARRFLEDRSDELHRRRGKAMVPLKPRDPLDRKPRSTQTPGALSPKRQEAEARRVFDAVRNRPDVASQYLAIQDLLTKARFAATQDDAQKLVDAAKRISGEIYVEFEAEAQRRELSLDKEQTRAWSAINQHHRRVLHSYGYFDASRIVTSKPPKPRPVAVPDPRPPEPEPTPPAVPWRPRSSRRTGEAAKSSSTWVSDQASRIGTHFGRKAGPIGALAAVTRLYNRQARRIALIGLVVGVLFIPVGFFTFSGWSIVALAMVITSAGYFVLLNIVKVVASILVAVLNAIFSFLIGVVVQAFEWILAGLGKAPTACEVGEASVQTTFCSGHQLAAEGLIPASELHAINISLLDPEDLKPTMSTKPLAQVLGEWTGLYHLDLGSVFGRAFGPRFQDWLEHGNLYAVIAVFFLPAALLGIFAYLKLVRPALQEAGVIGHA